VRTGTAISAAAISINDPHQTLEIGSGGNLTINAAENITNGTIKLSGGTLNDASGITIGSGATLSGQGTVTAPLSGSGTVTANGGSLVLSGALSSALSLSTGAAGGTLDIESNSTISAPALANINGVLFIGSGHSVTINSAFNAGNGGIQLGSGSMLTDASGIVVGGRLFGSGTVAADLSGTGVIRALSGTLDLQGNVANGLKLQIDSGNPGTVLKIDGNATTAEITDTSGVSSTFNSINQTLEIGSSGSLTITAAQTVTNGKIQLDGGTLTDAAGLTIGSGATLLGKGTVAAPVNGAGTVTANAGTLELSGAVDSTTASSFHIGSAAGSVLKFDGVVGTAVITFDGGSGVLDLTATTLGNFHGAIAGFTGSEEILVNGAAAAVISDDATFVTIYNSADGSLGTISLSGNYTGDEFDVLNRQCPGRC
jgi:hypothetical protein